MNILYLYNKGLMTPDLAISLIMAGHEVDTIENYECSYVLDDEPCRNKIYSAIKQKEQAHGRYDFVISYNYIPSASYVCDMAGLIYIAWMYDSWYPTLFSEPMRLSCNRIFVFDSAEYAYIKKMGVDHVYLLPLAVNDVRIGQLDFEGADAEKYKCDISFLGRLYGTPSRNGYSAMKNKLSDEMRAELDGIIDEAAGKWGENDWFLKLQKIDYSKIPVIEAADSRNKCLLEDDIYYTSLCFARAITQKDRTSILNMLAEKWHTCLYTFENPVDLVPKVDVRAGVDYANEMPKVFFNSRINLNITLRSIFAGIPLRAFDVMGSGGFLMMNKQKDMDDYFVDGVDYVSFDSVNDLKEKAEYYLNHESERRRILAHGYRKVCSYHTYQNRIEEMFETLSGNPCTP